MSTDVAQLHEAPPEAVEPDEPHARGARIAFWVFVAVEAFGFVLYAVSARRAWFGLDDWDFLAQRGLSIHDLLLPHGGHLVAIPALVYRLLFSIFGLHTYTPYQVIVIAMHIAVAAMLRAVMRREGVNPWIATATASLFLLFSSGIQDITSAFQITFTGAVVFGLVQLLLTDHDGPLDRRDWFALVAGLAAIACSGVGIAMVGVVGLATWMRRGWRVAALQVVPLVVIFELWLHFDETSDLPSTTNAKTLSRWVRRGLYATFDRLAMIPWAGWLLAALLVVGLTVAVRSWPAAERRARAAIPLSFVAGAVGFLAFTGYGRAWSGVQNAATSRYLYVYAALLMPPLAIAADALVRRRRTLLLPVLVVLLMGVPGSVSRITSRVYSTPVLAERRITLFSIARTPLAERVPRDLPVDPSQLPGVTIGWLLDGVHHGWLPKPGRALTPSENATNTLRLSLRESSGAQGAKCKPMPAGPTDLYLARGDRRRIHSAIGVQLVTDDALSFQLPFGPTFISGLGDHTVIAVAGPLHLRVAPRTTVAGIC